MKGLQNQIMDSFIQQKNSPDFTSKTCISFEREKKKNFLFLHWETLFCWVFFNKGTIFNVRVTEQWNRLPREAVESLRFEILKYCPR